MKFFTAFLLFIASLTTNAQNVGIGLTNPSVNLQVDSVIKIGKNLPINSGTPGRVNSLRFGDGTFVTIGEDTRDDQLNIRAGMVLINKSIGSIGAGNLGINVDSATAKLDVNGTVRLRAAGIPGIGKVLTSDAEGDATWQAPIGLALPFSGSSASNSATYAIFEILNTSTVSGAGLFETSNPANDEYALEVRSNGLFAALRASNTGSGGSGNFSIVNNANTQAALECYTTGTGPALLARSSSSSKDISIFRNNNGPVARIDGTGKGFFNGGTQSSGADVAEAFAVEGARDAYEPGDVLVISTASDRTVTKSTQPYSTLVVGVYATKPGVLLTERMENESQSDLVPMGVVGVIPTKVCSEGGAIHRGDLLVTSSTPGHAMKGVKGKIDFGTIIGKALEDFAAGNTGMIKVLVNVK